MSYFLLIDDIDNDERTPYFRDLIPSDLKAEGSLKVIGAVSKEGYPQGALTFTFQGWSVHILYIEVYPIERRMGIGTGLINALMEYLSPIEHSYVVEAIYEQEAIDKADVTGAFFGSLPDFEVVFGGKYCTVTPETVWNSQRLSLLENFSCRTKSVLELSNSEKTELKRYLREKNMENLMDFNEKELIPELSICNIAEGKCTSLVVFKRSKEKSTLELSFLMCRKGELDRLSGVLNEVIKRLKVMYPRHSLVFSLINKESELIAKRFFTKDIRISEIYEAVSYGIVR